MKWCYRNERLDVLPRNIDEPLHRFKKETTEVIEFDLQDVRKKLARLSERFLLYACLGLNCGMTQVDIGLMTHNMVKDGMLTRKREKTGKRKRQNNKREARTPTVPYPLWPETLALLGKFKSDHPERFLLSDKGKTLYEHKPKKDIISDRWIRSGPEGLWFTAFRSIGSTLVSRHPEFKGHETYFLANAPSGITAKHYVPPNKEEFRQLIMWLRNQIFPLPTAQ